VTDSSQKGEPNWKQFGSPSSTPLQQSSPVTITYDYDPLYRLTEANYSNGDYYHYGYDAVGNRLTEATQLSVTSYQYDDANRLTNVNGVTYLWDDNGNLLNDGVNAYTYDSANRLKTFMNATTTASYSYNGLGDRLQETVNGVTTTFTMDLNTGLTQVLNDGTNTYLYGNGRIAQAGITTEYFMSDALGSVRQLTNASGQVTLTKSYTPYGEALSSVGSGTSMYAFTGEQQDASGLTYLRARYYASDTGRFLTRDTWEGDAKRPLSYNKWNYVEGNPTNYTDPSGYWALGNKLEIYTGGFYGLGRLRIEGGQCLHDEFCYVPRYTWADIFVSPVQGTGNDIKYKVYQFPDSIDSQTLLQGWPYFLKYIERIDESKSTIGCIYPRRNPDVIQVNLSCLTESFAL
jgi:RHS repeat-associated protein